MNYFIKRILLLAPSLFLLSLLIFAISLSAPYLPEAAMEEYANRSIPESFIEKEDKLDQYRIQHGTFAPPFYIAFHPLSLADTLYKISDPLVRSGLKRWALELGNWPPIGLLHQKINDAAQRDSTRHYQYYALFESESMDQLIQDGRALNPNMINAQLQTLLQSPSTVGNLIPRFSWHGSNNRYHQWIGGLLSFDLGKSIVNGRPVSKTIAKALKWTLSLGLGSLLISLLIAIPLAVKTAQDPGGILDRFCQLIFFGLYSIPLFWMATLLLIFFASVHHLQWFPTFGIGEIETQMSAFEILRLRINHLTLPLICWTYGSLAILYRFMRAKLKEEMTKDYILAARSKGLSYQKTIWQHAFKNSAFPLITLLGASLPGLIGGSFVIESVFAIPGMGKLTLDAFLQRDYPLIFNLSFLACVATVLGVFLADLAYHRLDPRLNDRQNG